MTTISINDLAAGDTVVLAPTGDGYYPFDEPVTVTVLDVTRDGGRVHWADICPAGVPAEAWSLYPSEVGVHCTLSRP